MKRLFFKTLVWLLTISFIMTGTGELLPQAAGGLLGLIQTASAEEAPLPEAYSLEEDVLEEEQSSGNWRYALRSGDGYAVITGYDGKAASMLEIPASLDGADVVGIEEGALDIEGLRHVRMNGSIMYIADGAFGASEPVIHARNGSYALYWADSRGMEYENETAGTLVPGVIDYTDASEGSVMRRGESHVVFTPLAAKRLSVGSIFWFEDARGLQYFYRVTALKNEGRRVVATVEQPDLKEAVRELHYEDSIVVSAADFIPADGVNVSGGTSAYDIYTGTSEEEGFTTDFSIIPSNQKKKIGAKEEWTQRNVNEIHVTVDTDVVLRYRYDIVDGEVVHAETVSDKSYDVGLVWKGGRQFTNTIKDPIKKELKTPFKSEREIGGVSITTSIIHFDFDLRWKAQFTGEISGHLYMTETEKQVYDSNEGWVVEDKDSDMEIGLEGSVNGKFCLEGRVTTGLAHVLNFMQVCGEIGVKASFSGSIVSSDASAVPCWTLNIQGYVDFKVYLGAWLNTSSFIAGGRVELTPGFIQGLEDMINDIMPKFVRHFYLGFHKVEECPYKDVLTVTFDTRTDLELRSASVHRGRPIDFELDYYTLEDAPDGSKFLGWTEDIDSIEPTWSLGASGNVVEEAMTLYAVWEGGTTVRFDSMGGSAVPSQLVPANGYASNPGTPTKSGETFRYWYALDEYNLPQRWNFRADKVPSGGITLYAMWSDGEMALDGTQTVSFIGDKSVFKQDFGTQVSSTNYFTYEEVTDPNGEVIGVTITGVKNDPVNLKVPPTLTIPLIDALGDLFHKTVNVVGINSDAFSGNKNIRKISFDLPNLTITSTGLFSNCTSLVCADMSGTNLPAIPDESFYGCSSLECVKLPAGVKEIGASAFQDCASVKKFILPNGLKTIGDGAFDYCDSLEELYIPDSVTQISYGIVSIVYGDGALRKLTIGGVDTIQRGWFEIGLNIVQDSLEEIVILGSVKHIGDNAFHYYGNAYDSSIAEARLVIHEGVESIGSDAFGYATALTEVILPDSLKSIGEEAFYRCDRIRSLKMGSGVETIGNSAFEDCYNIEDFNFGPNLQSIDTAAFSDCDSVQKFILPNGLKTIGYDAFNYCDSLEELYIPDSVTQISYGRTDSIVYGAGALRKLTVGGVDTIQKGWFDLGSDVVQDALEEIVILGSVNHIGDNAFYYGYPYDSSVAEARLVIHEGVESIGNRAFLSASALTEVILPDSLKSIGEAAFSYCIRVRSLKMGSSVETIGDRAFEGCHKLEDFSFGPNLQSIGARAFCDCESVQKFILPNGLKTIGYAAFSSCDKLEELYIPDSVTQISSGYDSIVWGDGALRKLTIGGVDTIQRGWFKLGDTKQDSLEEIVILGSVKHIGDNAFYYNGYPYDSSVAEARLVIHEGVESIGSQAFGYATALTEVILPDSLKSIGEEAFYRCDRIRSLKMGSGVETIGNSAFGDCHKLEDFSFGPKLQSIGTAAFSDCDSVQKFILPNGLKTIGDGAFNYCDKLEELYIPDSVTQISSDTDSIVYGDGALRKLTIGGVDTIQQGWFELGDTKQDSLEEIVILGSVNHIGDNAFYYNSYAYDSDISEARLVIHEGVETIGSDAFSYATALTEVVLPDSLKSIGNQAFYYCSRVRSLKMGSGVETIGDRAFEGCNGLNVYLDESSEYVQGYFATANIPCSVGGVPVYSLELNANGGTFADGTSVHTRYLAWESAIEEIEVPEKGADIFCGWYTDEACTLEWTLEAMPSRNLTLYAGWNVDCHNLCLNANGGSFDSGDAEMRFIARSGSSPAANIAAQRDGYSFTGWYTDAAATEKFDGVMPGEDITLYAGWSEPSVNADYEFENGEAILVNYALVEFENDEVYLPASVNGMPLTGIADYAFYGEAVTKLYLPAGVRSIAENAFSGMDSLCGVYVNPGNESYCDSDGVLMSKDGSELIFYPAQKGQSYRLPDGVRKIAAYAFCESDIRAVTLNDGLVEIGDYAFSGTSLSRLILPASVEKIGRCAFSDCRNIYTVSAGAELSEIGELAFSGCGSPLSIYGPIEDCAIKTYAQTYGHSYNQYLLTLNYPDASIKQRIAQAGTALSLPSAPAMPENAEFTGWYSDTLCTVPWTADMRMPAAELTLYGGSTPIFSYETVEITDEATGEVHSALRLTAYLSENSSASVPETIGGVTVEEIGANCFGSHVTSVSIPDCVKRIEDGAFASASVQIICSEGSAAQEYAEKNGSASSLPRYEISFAVNGGAEIAPVTAEEGSMISLPVPVRSGCEPAGWYLDKDLTQAAGLDADGKWSVPENDAVLYAAWTITDEVLANPLFTYRQENSAIIVTGAAEGTEELIIPESLHGLPVTAMEASAFRGETGLVRLQLPGTMLSIPDNAFRGCTALESVTLSEGILTIGTNVFYGCSALEVLVLPDSLTTAGAKAFANSGIAQLSLGAQFKQIASDALNNCPALESISVSAENAYYSSIDSVLYDDVDAVLVKYPSGSSRSAYSVDVNYYAVGAYAFQGASRLERVVLHSDIWELGEYAFQGCTALSSLPEMTGSYLTTIPAHCFDGCTSLTEVEIPAAIEVIDEYAFTGCSALKTAVVPETVVYIGTNALSTSGMTIYGATGSAAEEYANENGILFVDPDGTILPESISISGYESILSRGQTIGLTAAILPENATLTDVFWSSSDESVARVSADGLLRAIGGGEAVISAVTANGISAEIAVEVDSTIYPRSITLDIICAELSMGETLQLTASVVPDDAVDTSVSWSSSDEAIASVENGLITPVAEGSAVITAATSNGLTASCTVNIVPDIEQIILEGAAGGQCFKTGDSLQLSASVLPEDADDKSVIWTASDERVASVDENGLVRFTGHGFVTITVRSALYASRYASVTLECAGDAVLSLPAGLEFILAEAFSGSSVESVVISEKTQSIGAKAFANCESLYKIVIPGTVSEIAEDAFEGSARVTICAPEGSPAHSHALARGIAFIKTN